MNFLSVLGILIAGGAALADIVQGKGDDKPIPLPVLTWVYFSGFGLMVLGTILWIFTGDAPGAYRVVVGLVVLGFEAFAGWKAREKMPPVLEIINAYRAGAASGGTGEAPSEDHADEPARPDTAPDPEPVRPDGGTRAYIVGDDPGTTVKVSTRKNTRGDAA